VSTARAQLPDEEQEALDDVLLRRAQEMRFGVYEAIEDMEDQDEEDSQ